MREILLKLARRQDLSTDEVRRAFDAVLAGGAGEARTAGLLMGLAGKGVTGGELAAAAGVLRQHLVPVRRDGHDVVLDTCGTGGTGRALFNVSTTAALLVAACGVKVVKHGGRGSGVSGSADVLEALGVRLDLSPERLRACLDAVGVCFAFARNHHPALRHAAPVRAALGVPTIFNMVAPLLNPASACHQLVGAFDFGVARLIAGVLRDTGSKRAWVVHAEDGLDELSTLGPTRVCELRDGRLSEWTLDPASLGLARATADDLRATSPADSAASVRAVLSGEIGPRRDIAALNAAAGLVIAGAASDLRDGLGRVGRAIDGGNARRTLETLIAFV